MVTVSVAVVIWLAWPDRLMFNYTCLNAVVVVEWWGNTFVTGTNFFSHFPFYLHPQLRLSLKSSRGIIGGNQRFSGLTHNQR